MTKEQFVSWFADAKPYVWNADEGYDDDQAGDAIRCMNDMIVEARKILGLSPLKKVGEQED